MRVLIACLLCLVACGPLCAQQVGDVVRTKQAAKLRVGAESPGEVAAGEPVTVLAARPPWPRKRSSHLARRNRNLPLY